LTEEEDRTASEACEEDEGRPKYQVMRFHAIAPTRPAINAVVVIASSTSNPSPMVVATATPNRKGPMKCAAAAIISALRGGIAPELMGVATTFELSWKPFKKSKTSASAMRMKIIA
jgi:hypothetical protein